ncbi:hypothetical protein LZ198_09305 [Myxococcus sp. K15C18031901]|uniref:hypothetical protein n=1 Tax=Myxococcus dinghuensis TaxID=2906761 RepID=UPI0020A7C0F4|nr:hypothetical protein [Myxococcus dinghuensis]MCP3099065.1 hypothetical protein [Myxococcus dinghuensis]
MMTPRLSRLLGAVGLLGASPAWAQGAESALGAWFTAVVALGVLSVVVVVGLLTVQLNRDKPQRSVPIALGIITGLAKALAGGGLLVFLVVGSIRSLFTNGSVALEGVGGFLLGALGLLALGGYEVRVAWKAMAPPPPSQPSRQA